MSVWLPEQRPTTSGLYVADVRKDVSVSPPAAGGTCIAAFDPVADPDYCWYVDRCLVECTSSAGTVAAVYDGPTATLAHQLDATRAGNGDTADNNAPYLVLAGETLTIVWTGAADGAIGTARIQYRVLRRA